MEVGRICQKIMGREKGKYCVIIEKIDTNFVIIDGYVKKRKCNVNHLKILDKNLELDKKISKEDIIKKLEKEGFKQKETVKIKEKFKKVTKDKKKNERKK
ncbi:50S ribosomal protein L14e [Candidatus Pacearchaeota archaeon CG1_02_31_27]|nr:MAG: 50S ribosomal protein L14e [Candidatus Pacearchaeota archaeon CG1_02_31_27]PIN92381.1 MAG: 50S ribosomal protein L14e [Candidatus Pacearchaeota archaeon CG10_big_fil_rev_8_21_14_0_10_31_59]PIZ80684.1 MAG: 50S ribosomal protein L14e [Candidatus Pacearchaeota archaeon CG_4_10_14_0_2_um_filter_31_10]